jgi:hypothetical protein
MRNKQGEGKWKDRRKKTANENQLALKVCSHSGAYSQNVQISPPLYRTLSQFSPVVTLT